MREAGRARAAITIVALVATACGGGGSGGGDSAQAVTTTNPILFVTQVPQPADFATIGSTFANHRKEPDAAPRGGDLWIRYGDGTLRNLTAEAGFGNAGLQGANSIAVREPCVHWSGTKAVFSLLLGSPAQFQSPPNPWQLYEVTGFLPGETAVITKVPFQPSAYNNVSPAYASDGRILFASDRPRDGSPHLYPQLDEYEEAPSTSGLWSLDPDDGTLFLLNHSPSGVFSPSVDASGRVVFSRWDHLVRDQQADDDHIAIAVGNPPIFDTFNWADESAGAPTGPSVEVFPEPRKQWLAFVDEHPGYAGPLHGYEPYLVGNEFNHFFPWTIHQDGTEEETLNHLGRHELHGYFDASRDDDPNLVTFLDPTPFTANTHPIVNVLQIAEDPGSPGTYWAVDAPEFFTHAAGQVIRVHAPPGMSADDVTVDYVTPRETSDFTTNPTSLHTGLYRNPLPLTDGQVVVVHTAQTNQDDNIGTYLFPRSRYDFRLKALVPSGAYHKAGAKLTGSGLSKSVQWWDPNQLVSYNGLLWELDPVEVVARAVPPEPTSTVAAPELSVLAAEAVTLATLRNYLRSNDLALLISRDVTTRDRNDRQQPFNLRVAGTTTETVVAPGTVYEVAHFQIFQGDQLRGLTYPGGSEPLDGRRVIAKAMHEPNAENPPNPTGPAGSVAVADDGSIAALVPARRALSWQLTDEDGIGIVRERYWVTFQPGEIRTCVSCHGASSAVQDGGPPPTNPPQALARLLQHLKGQGEL